MSTSPNFRCYKLWFIHVYCIPTSSILGRHTVKELVSPYERRRKTLRYSLHTRLPVASRFYTIAIMLYQFYRDESFCPLLFVYLTELTTTNS